ncbi:MAG: sugar phosphate isomerase/epimerase [Candidatus Latescibacterota bacterium]
MSDTCIGAQLFTLRDYLKTPEDITKTLRALREIGYEALQVSGVGPIAPRDLKKILDDEGLMACATHTGYDPLVKETERVIDEHKILGASHAVCPGLAPEYHNAQGYATVARELSKVGKILKEKGITLSYHNHATEFEKYGDRIGLDILYEESDPAYLQAELDTYWVQSGGGDPAAWCRKLAGRLPLLHLKDMGIQDNKQIMMEVGEGNLEWEGILSACRAGGTQWYLVEQDVCQRHPLESLKISLENMRAMGLS